MTDDTIPTQRARAFTHRFLETVKEWLQNFGRREIVLVAALLLLAGGAWLFVSIADEVVEGDTQTFDEWMILSLRNPADVSDPLGPKWLEELGRDFTALGGMGILIGLTLMTVGYLILERRGKTAAFVGIAIGAGMSASFLLKMSFSRPRPNLVSHETWIYTTSFPSGHSMMAALTYLTLAALLAHILQPRRRGKIYLVLMALIVTLCVGVSRVYLGVHWPTDVLAGWTAGAFWALLSWTLAFRLQRRGDIEPSAIPNPESES